MYTRDSTFIEWLVTLVRGCGVDAVFASGGMFNHVIPSVNALVRIHRALRELTEITTLIPMPGNHGEAAHLKPFTDMLTPSLHVVADPEAIDTPVGTEGVFVYPMPYLEPDLMHQSPSDLPTRDEADLPTPLPHSHQAILRAASRWVRTDSSARRDAGDGRPTIAMPHTFATDAQASDSERDIQVNDVPSVLADLFDTLGDEEPLTHGLDYVMAEHLYHPRDISSASVPIRHTGPLIAHSLSEARATKPITLLTTGATSVTDIEVVPIPTLQGIMVLEETMDELFADPDEATTASYMSIMITDDTRPERMVPHIQEVYPRALIVVHHPSQASTFVPAITVHTPRDPRGVAKEFYEVAGERVLGTRKRGLALDVWAQLQGKDAQWKFGGYTLRASAPLRANIRSTSRPSRTWGYSCWADRQARASPRSLV